MANKDEKRQKYPDNSASNPEGARRRADKLARDDAKLVEPQRRATAELASALESALDTYARKMSALGVDAPALGDVRRFVADLRKV